MQKRIKIPLQGNKLLYGTLSYKESKPTRLVILVHGLFDSEDTALFVKAAQYFNQRGFAVFRFNLYHWEEGARRFRDTTLSGHSKDVDTVASYFKKRFKSIFLVGHSYGGLTVMRSNLDYVSAISLWDPSSLIAHPPSYYKYSRKYGKYLYRGSTDVLVEKKYVEDLRRFPDELEVIAGIEPPLQIAYAAGKEGVLIESSKRYFKYANDPKQLLPIKKASHSFREEGVSKILFKEVLSWFKKHE